MVEFRSATLADSDAICDLWNLASLGGGRSVDGHEIAVRLENDDGFFVMGALSFWRELNYVDLPAIHYFTKEL